VRDVKDPIVSCPDTRYVDRFAICVDDRDDSCVAVKVAIWDDGVVAGAVYQANPVRHTYPFVPIKLAPIASL